MVFSDSTAARLLENFSGLFLHHHPERSVIEEAALTSHGWSLVVQREALLTTGVVLHYNH